MGSAGEPRHDEAMVNDWTWWLAAGTAAAAALTFAVAAAFRRRPRAVGLGVLLIPVTALCLWSFGLTTDSGGQISTRLQGLAVQLPASSVQLPVSSGQIPN